MAASTSLGGEPDFYATDQGQFIANAYRYLFAAKALRFSKDWKRDAGRIHTPVLHLLAHGTELLLKFPSLRSGKTQKEIRDSHGHSISSIWRSDETGRMRKVLLERSSVAWEVARQNRKWRRDDFSGEPAQAFEEALDALSYLHDRASGFALRYVLPPGDTIAPRPAFLLEVLEPVAEMIAKNPSYLDDWYQDK